MCSCIAISDPFVDFMSLQNIMSEVTYITFQWFILDWFLDISKILLISLFTLSPWTILYIWADSAPFSIGNALDV